MRPHAPRMHAAWAPYICVPHAPHRLYDVVLYCTLAQITEKCGKYSCFSWGLSCGVPKAAGLAMASTPEWASKHNLEICGQYYQGFVDDLEAVLSVLSQHHMCTVITYGVRRSRSNASSPALHLVQERRMKVLPTNILVRQLCVTISVVLFSSTGIKWRVEKT